MQKRNTSIQNRTYQEIVSLVKGKVLFNEPLNRHTTFRIGGKAAVWFEPKDKNDLITALDYCLEQKIRFFIIGAGSNLLIKESGFKGLVLNLSSEYFTQIKRKGSLVYAGAGVKISSLIKYTLDSSLRGFEFLAGMPGTVGGAIAMNVGTHSPDDFSEQHNISDLLESIEFLDRKNKFHKISARNLKFSYRKSNLKSCLILSACFKLEHNNKNKIKEQVHKYLDYRMKTQDYTHPSAGCIFKNPKGVSSGFLIDACGLKGKRIGNAMISKKHANFILNVGNANSKSVLKLINLASDNVEEAFGVDLEPEIQIVGD